MPKKYRLSRADLARLPRPTRRVHGDYFSLTATCAPILRCPRAVCVVSKKVSARSVDRNRVERFCRESLRPILTQMKKPIALILYAKREARDASHADVKKDIEKLLRSIDARDRMLTL